MNVTVTALPSAVRIEAGGGVVMVHAADVPALAEFLRRYPAERASRQHRADVALLVAAHGIACD